MNRIEVLERFSIEGVAYYPGEVRQVEKDVAETACSNGWAKDADGVIPTGERDPTAKKLDIGKVGHSNATKAAS